MEQAWLFVWEDGRSLQRWTDVCKDRSLASHHLLWARTLNLKHLKAALPLEGIVPFYQIGECVIQILSINHVSWKLIGLRRHIKKKKGRWGGVICEGWEMEEYWMPFLGTWFQVSFVLPGILCCTVKCRQEVLGGRALELLLLLSAPLMPCLCVCYCSSVLLGARPSVSGHWCPNSALPPLLHSLADGAVTDQLQGQLAWATPWDRLAVVLCRTAPLQGWPQGPIQKIWAWRFSIAALDLFLLPRFHLRARPQTLHVVIMCNWYDQI